MHCIRIRRTWIPQYRWPNTALQSRPFLHIIGDALSPLTEWTQYMLSASALKYKYKYSAEVPAALGLQISVVSRIKQGYELLLPRINNTKLLSLWTSCIASKLPRFQLRNETTPVLKSLSGASNDSEAIHNSIWTLNQVLQELGSNCRCNVCVV